MEYKNIVFDVDGTLLDTYETSYKAKERVLKEYNISYTKEKIDDGFSLTSKEGLEIFNIDLNTDLGKEIMEKETHYYDEYSYLITFFPDVEKVLKELKKQGKNLGIITSRSKQELTDEIHIHKIIDLFDIIITASDIIKPKPHRESFELLFNKTGWNKKETLYIGDSRTDSLCSDLSRIDFGLALWGAVDKNIPATYKFEKINELEMV